MNVYNFKKIEKCYVSGNIDQSIDKFINTVTSHLTNFKKKEHPKEIERQARLKAKSDAVANMRFGGAFNNAMDAIRAADIGMERAFRRAKKGCETHADFNSYNDSVIIVSGNCGIGNKSKKYYEETFYEFNKILADNNCYVLFVRGNNDDPSYFENKLIDFEHVKTIPDYSVIALKTFNCLCVGGSISIDKEWKLSQEERFGKKLYWNNEAPNFNEKELEEILTNFRISCVITSTSPSFTYPGTNAFKHSKWFSDDKSVLNEFSNERKVIDKVYEKIIETSTKPYIWLYGRFKMANDAKINDIVFASLRQHQIYSINNSLSLYFGLDTSKELGDNDHSFDNLIQEEEGKKINYFEIPNEPFGENDVEAEIEDDNTFYDEEEGLTIEAAQMANAINMEEDMPTINETTNNAVRGIWEQWYHAPTTINELRTIGVTNNGTD